MFWWNVSVKDKTTYLHYYKKEWTSGNGYTCYGSGYEIINPKTNKVVYRRGRNTNNLDSRDCDWQDIDVIFTKNID